MILQSTNFKPSALFSMCILNLYFVLSKVIDYQAQHRSFHQRCFSKTKTSDTDQNIAPPKGIPPFQGRNTKLAFYNMNLT